MTEVVLETERLTLRRLTMADVDDLVELDSDPAVMQYISGGAPTPRQELAGKLRRWITDPAGFGRMAAIGLDWDDPIEGTEEGDVLYAMTRARWSAR